MIVSMNADEDDAPVPDCDNRVQIPSDGGSAEAPTADSRPCVEIRPGPNRSTFTGVGRTNRGRSADTRHGSHSPRLRVRAVGHRLPIAHRSWCLRMDWGTADEEARSAGVANNANGAGAQP